MRRREMCGKDAIEITDDIRQQIQKAVDIVGSKCEVGRRLRYSNRNVQINRILNGTQKSLPKFRYERLTKILKAQ